jgi:hypothetical protein
MQDNIERISWLSPLFNNAKGKGGGYGRMPASQNICNITLGIVHLLLLLVVVVIRPPHLVVLSASLVVVVNSVVGWRGWWY